MGSINLSIVNLELCEGILNLSGREFVAKGHQLCSECLGINLSVLLESLERSEDDIVVIRASSHLGSEEGDHLGEVHGAINLVKHGLGITTTYALTMSTKCSHQV